MRTALAIAVLVFSMYIALVALHAQAQDQPSVVSRQSSACESSACVILNEGKGPSEGPYGHRQLPQN